MGGRAEKSSFSFRNRFRLLEHQQLDSGDVLEIRLADRGGETVVIRGAKAPKGEATRYDSPVVVSTTAELVLLGGEYASVESARAAGCKWRQTLMVALARENLGVDFGPDDQIEPQAEITYALDEHPPEIMRQIGVKAGERVVWDDGYKLTVYGTHPKPRFISAEFGNPTLSLSGWLTRFEQRVEFLGRAYVPWGQDKKLAYRLVHSALRDSNPETRHIQMVTAAEVLVEERQRAEAVIQALSMLEAHVDSLAGSPADGEPLTEETLERLRQILRDNKRESITQAGAQQAKILLTTTYSGKSPDAFFKEVYNQRSRLVHRLKRSQRRPSSEELSGVQHALLAFVLDLLDAVPD
ncbi:hypothetical protein ACFWE3_07450 [Mycobacteriaceae bacterium NPDC060252]